MLSDYPAIDWFWESLSAMKPQRACGDRRGSRAADEESSIMLPGTFDPVLGKQCRYFM